MLLPAWLTGAWAWLRASRVARWLALAAAVLAALLLALARIRAGAVRDERARQDRATLEDAVRVQEAQAEASKGTIEEKRERWKGRVRP